MFLTINERTSLNLEVVNSIELHPGSGSVTVEMGSDGGDPRYREFTGDDAEAIRNWCRSATMNAYPDRLELRVQTSQHTTWPARAAAAGGISSS